MIHYLTFFSLAVNFSGGDEYEALARRFLSLFFPNSTKNDDKRLIMNFIFRTFRIEQKSLFKSPDQDEISWYVKLFQTHIDTNMK